MHVLVKKFIVKEFSIKQPKSHHKCQTFIIKKKFRLQKEPQNVNVAFQTQYVCFDF